MSETPTTTDFILELDARPDLLRVVRAALAAWCERVGVETAQTDQICLAVDEASTNIIRHAYAGECGHVRLICSQQTRPSGRSVLITLEDDGKQVPLETIRPRELDNVKPGGLGVHLIQQVMDEAVWCHKPDGGTSLTMRVDIDQARSGVQQENITHA